MLAYQPTSSREWNSSVMRGIWAAIQSVSGSSEGNGSTYRSRNNRSIDHHQEHGSGDQKQKRRELLAGHPLGPVLIGGASVFRSMADAMMR